MKKERKKKEIKGFSKLTEHGLYQYDWRKTISSYSIYLLIYLTIYLSICLFVFFMYLLVNLYVF